MQENEFTITQNIEGESYTIRPSSLAQEIFSWAEKRNRTLKQKGKIMKGKKKKMKSEGKRIRQLAAEAKAKHWLKMFQNAYEWCQKNKKLTMLFQRIASSLYEEVLATIEEDAEEGEVESYFPLRDLGDEPYLDELELGVLERYLDKSQQKKVVNLLVKKLKADGFKAKAKWETRNWQDMTDECHSEEYFGITIKF